MGKQFELRLSRMIPLFQSCRSKDPSKLPENPVPSFFHLSPINPKPIDTDFTAITPPLKPHQASSVKRQVSSAILSVGCGCRSTCDEKNEPAAEFRWKKEEKWHVVAKIHDEITTTPRRKIYNSSVSSDSGYEICESPAKEKKMMAKKNQRNKKKRTKQKQSSVRFSTSSADSGWFSSDGIHEEEEEETLVSFSRTFSNADSSSELFNTHLETIRESPIHESFPQNKKKSKRVSRKVKRYSSSKSNKRGGSSTVIYPSSETESPARLSVFQRLMKPSCEVEGKVKESFAVVKKSKDPYEDFRRSMMEMILEKQMFEVRDLEQLLHCFLSLNSQHHHQIIVEVFSEIWEELFCTSSPLNQRVSVV